ncbi:MAG TPA: metal ABC transporter substrate-binding protein [Candidatus Acidoferrales bacterium]|nr:metal ABC transporter substrate-binding protein [Candidatus Acidoferrales bacterium]
MTRAHQHLLAKLLVILLALQPIFACRRETSNPPTRGANKLKVVTTVAPITSIVENVAGDKAEIVGIIPEGINSHTFEPIPSDVKIIAAADLIVVNGLDLEIPTLNLANANKKPSATILKLGDNTIKESEYVYDFSFPKEHGHPNPHLWLNPVYVIRYAELVRDKLIELDQKNKSAYENNAAEFIKKLRLLDRAIQEAVQTIPPPNRRLLTYHDSWPYFARRYGFQIIGAVQPSDFSDPSPREVARLIEQIKKEKVPAVFGSEVFPSPVLEQIAREAKTRYIDKLRDDELPGKPGAREHSYIGMMVENLTVLFEALGGSAASLKKVDPAPVAGSHADYRRKR